MATPRVMRRDAGAPRQAPGEPRGMRHMTLGCAHSAPGGAVADRGGDATGHGKKIIAAWDGLLDMLNGCWWERGDGEHGKLVHICRRNGSCCKGKTDVERRGCAVDKLTRALLNTLLGRRPQRASSNKWNKLLPGFDFFALGYAVHG
eukprot:4972921-Pyramimonas_sp.AAC.1